jgi:hypothetical protein
MIPAFLASGIILYGIMQLIAAFIAVFLAVKWNKYEFLPGLFFLFLYALIEVIDLLLFTILEGIFIDVAQFGFILLAIIFFIVGMHPSWAQKLLPAKKDQFHADTPLRKESAISLLKKI